jgi:hypothetical protein
MGDYVRSIFLAKAPLKPAPAPAVLDRDGDGVPDHLDKCPGTPKGHRSNRWSAGSSEIYGSISIDPFQAQIAVMKNRNFKSIRLYANSVL